MRTLRVGVTCANGAVSCHGTYSAFASGGSV